MSDPEPIEINERAQAAVLVAQRVDGEFIPVRAASDGSLATSGGGGGATTVDQGAAAALADAWPVELTDGTSVLGTAAHPVRVDPTGTTAQPVTASALPLPTGAATEAKQDAGNTSLDSIDTKFPEQGQALRAASLPVVIASDQSAFPVNASQTGTWTVAQGTPGASAWKVDGSAITQPISATSLPLPTNAAQDRTTAASPHAVRLTDGASFYIGLQRGGDVKADIRVGSVDVANGNPVPISDAGGSVTVDSPQLPAALGAGGGIKVDGSGTALPISAASLPLPSGAATSALQGAGLPSALTSGGGVKVGVVDALPAGTSTIGAVRFDRAHLSPFSHLVAQSLSFVAQGSFTYGINSFVGTTAASGTGASVDTTSGVLRVQSGTSSTGDATYLCNEALIYRGGQGVGMTWSQAFPAGVANNTTIGGPSTTATNADGYFFGTKGTSFGIHHYRSGSEVQFIAQASWNGTVPSGFDPTKFNVYDVRYSSGAGDIFFMIQDPTTGFPYVVHTIRYASTSTILSVSSPSMKFLVRSVNSGNTTNVTTLVGAFGQFLFGAPLVDGPPFAFNNQKAVTGGTETNIFSIRVATTLNGVANRGAARVRLATAVADNGNTITAFFARLNATVGGSPSFSPYNGSTADNGVTLTSANSMLSFDTAGTTVTGAATTVAINTGCARNSQVPLDFTNMNIELRPGETWTISALPGANCNCAVFFNGIETW